MQCKLQEGTRVNIHELKMKSYTDELKQLGFPFGWELTTNIIPNSLTNSYNQFILKFFLTTKFIQKTSKMLAKTITKIRQNGILELITPESFCLFMSTSKPQKKYSVILSKITSRRGGLSVNTTSFRNLHNTYKPMNIIDSRSLLWTRIYLRSSIQLKRWSTGFLHGGSDGFYA